MSACFIGRIVVNVDDDDLGAALLAGADRMRHDVDLGRDGIGAPDHDAIGFRHFARIGAAQRAGAHDTPVQAWLVQIVSKKPEYPWHGAGGRWYRAVPAHRAGVIIGPDRLRAVRSFGLDEGVGDLVERVVPCDLLPSAGTLGARAAHRMHQPVGMIEPLGIASDLGADHAGGIAVAFAPRARPIRPIGTSRYRARRSKDNRADRRNGPCGEGQLCSCPMHSAKSGRQKYRFLSQ